MGYKYILIFLLALLSFSASANGFNYQAAVRLDDGRAVSNAEIRLKASIVTDINSDNSIYTEDHFVRTNSNGMINIIIGKGIPSAGNWNEINWVNQLYLKTVAIVDGKEQIANVSSIVGVPKAISAAKTDKLVRKSSDGNTWELKVNDVGDLSWSKLAPGKIEYPKEKWPDELYLVGSFSDWDIASAKKFTKLSDGRFATKCQLNTGDIIKFTKLRSWNSDIDWSGTSGKPGIKSSLQEWGNTPTFEGESNIYMIIVDFNTFTLYIYLQ